MTPDTGASARSARGTLGMFEAALAAALWGLSGPISKLAMQGGVEPRALLVLRLWISGLLMLGWLALRRPAALRLPRPLWMLVAMLGLAMGALQLFYYLTIQAANVATAVFLEYLAPTIVVLYGWLSGRQAWERWSVLAVATALAGSYLLVATTGVGQGGLAISHRALATGLGAAGTLALQAILLERLVGRCQAPTLFLYATAAAALLALAVGDPSSALHIPTDFRTIAALCYIILGATITPLLLLMAAVDKIGAAKAGVTNTLEPVVAGLAAVPILGEAISASQWVGGLLIVVAVVFISRAPSPRRAPGR